MKRPMLLVAVLLVRSLASPCIVTAQNTDSLARLLDATEWDVRSGGVTGLGLVPIARTPAAVVTKLIQLLEREALTPDPAGVREAARGDERYGEYVLDLAQLVLDFRDPRSLRGMAWLGIQTGRNAKEFVASYGSRSLPFLQEAWNADETARFAIEATWVLMLNRFPDRLTSSEQGDLRNRLLNADDHSFAIAAQQVPLPEAIPLLERIARETSVPGIKGSANEVLKSLVPLRAALSAGALLAHLQDWLRAFCADATGETREACPELTEKLQAAARHLARGERSEARESLRGFLAKLRERQGWARGGRDEGRRPGGLPQERAGGPLGARAYLLLIGNAEYLLTRL